MIILHPPTCLIRVVHFYWWGGEFSSRMFFLRYRFFCMNYFRPVQRRGINFFKATRSSGIFFKRFSFTRIFIFCILPRLLISNGPSLSSVRRYVLLNSWIQEHDFEPMQFFPRILASKTHYFYFPVIHHYFTATI